MGNTETKTLTVKESYEIKKKLIELYSVVLEYLIIKKSLTNDIKTDSFMKGYKSENCEDFDDKEECESGIDYKKDAKKLIQTKTGNLTKTGETREQAINNVLKYFGHDTSDDFVNIDDTSKIILDQKLYPLEFQIDSLITDIYRLKSNFKHAKKKSIKKVNKKVKSINKSKKKSKPKRVL